MKIGEVKDHIGEEWVLGRGNWSARSRAGSRVRIEGIETHEVRRYYTRSPMNKRYVRVTYLDIETGAPRIDNQGHPATGLIEATELDQPWAHHWEQTQVQRERVARQAAVAERLNRHLPQHLWVGHGFHELTLDVTAAEMLADLLETHIEVGDEEG